MEELEKDVKYFTRLWQEELTRRQAAEAALRNLVAAADFVGQRARVFDYKNPDNWDCRYSITIKEGADIADAIDTAKEVLK